MRVLSLCITILFASGACDEQGSPTAPPTPLPVIVAFGDSLTAGPGLAAGETFPALLQRQVTESGFQYRIVNAGMGGDTTTTALARFAGALPPETRIVILAIGINDGLRGTPVATAESNIARMIEQAQARRIHVLLCAMEAPPVRGLSYSLEFHRMYIRLAERYALTLVPFFLLGIVGNQEWNLDDTLHPNAAGHRIIAETIWPYLRPLLSRN